MSTNPMRRGLHGFVALCLMAVPVTAQSATPVTDAAMRGDLATLRSVLRGGADVNATQGDGMTALHWASHNGHADVARVLIYAGANLRATTRMGGYTPLILASANGHAEVIEALLQAGADPNATTSTGTTPIHLAAGAGSAHGVAALLDHGADVNVVESVYEQTPLMFAASNNRTDAMAVLIDRGADLALATKVVPISELTAEASEERRVRNARVRALRQAMEAPARNDGGRFGRGGFQAQRGGGARGQRGAAPAHEAEADVERRVLTGVLGDDERWRVEARIDDVVSLRKKPTLRIAVEHREVDIAGPDDGSAAQAGFVEREERADLQVNIEDAGDVLVRRRAGPVHRIVELT